MQITRIETGFLTIEMQASEALALAKSAHRAKMDIQEEWEWLFLDTAGSALNLAGRVASLAAETPEAHRMLAWLNDGGDDDVI